MSVKLLHPLKAYSPIDVTVGDILMSSKLLQSLNVLLPIFSRLSGIFAVVKFRQPISEKL